MRIAWLLPTSLNSASDALVYHKQLIQELRAEGDAVDTIPISANVYRFGLRVALRLLHVRYDAVVGDLLCAHPLAVIFPLVRTKMRCVLSAYAPQTKAGWLDLNVESTVLVMAHAVITPSSAYAAKLAAERFLWNVHIINKWGEACHGSSLQTSPSDQDGVDQIRKEAVQRVRSVLRGVAPSGFSAATSATSVERKPGN